MPTQVTMRNSGTLEVRRSPDYKTYYCNQTRLRMAHHDLQLFFGQIDDEGKSDRQINNELMSLIISPTTAKLLSLVLTAALQRYETEFGVINLPVDVAKQIASLKTQFEAASALAKAQTAKP